MKRYLDASMAFSEYEALIERLVEEGKTTGPKQSEAYANFTRLNLQRMNRLAKTIEVDESTKAALSRVDKSQVWLIITEAWCGDAAQNVPMIEKIAAESGKIETRYILRDEYPELIDRFLTFGTRSIPKLIALDAGTLEVLFTWGARPAAVQELFARLREEGVDKPAILEQLQRWYNEDKGRSIQAEFVGLLARKDGITAGAAGSL